MSNERFIPAQPGYRAWAIVGGINGKRYAFFSGDVVAWHMARAEDCDDDDNRFVAKPVTVNGEGAETIVIRDGERSAFTEGNASTFELWLRSERLTVCATDADLAHRLYGIGDDLIEAAPAATEANHGA